MYGIAWNGFEKYAIYAFFFILLLLIWPEYRSSEFCCPYLLTLESLTLSNLARNIFVHFFCMYICFFPILHHLLLVFLNFECITGQIELFSHVPVLKNFAEHLKRRNFNVCAVYLLDSQVCSSYILSSFLFLPCCLLPWPLKFLFYLHQFITDVTKFISGCMASLSAMIQLELPHVNILTKMDLVTNKRDLEEWDP